MTRAGRPRGPLRFIRELSDPRIAEGLTGEFDADMDLCRRSFNAGNVAAIVLAVNICADQPLPEWLAVAVIDIAAKYLRDHP